MSQYTEGTPVTPDLLRGAIALELKRVPINRERVEMYARALASMTEPDD